GGIELRVMSVNLVRHIFSVFAHASLASVPNGAAQFVERRMCAFQDEVTLYRLHAFEVNVETRIVSVFQQHEFAAVPTGFDLAKTLELADAVIHVDHIVAGFQFGKIAKETGSANFPTGALDGRRDVEEIGMAKKGKARVGKRDAFGEGRANQQHGRGFVGALGSKSSSGIFRFTENVGHFIFAADVGKAFDLSGACGRQENGSAGSELGVDLSHASTHMAA